MLKSLLKMSITLCKEQAEINYVNKNSDPLKIKECWIIKGLRVCENLQKPLAEASKWYDAVIFQRDITRSNQV